MGLIRMAPVDGRIRHFRSPVTVGAACLALLLSACASTGPAVFPRGVEEEDARRHPDGVAIDPASAPPPARYRATVDEGLVTLRTPLGVDLAIATVETLFRKIVREDTEGLDALFTRDAHVVTSAGGGNPAQMNGATYWWEQRFRRLDYTKLAGEPIYRPSEMEVYRGEDLGASERPSAGAGDPPPAPLPGTGQALRGEALGETDVVIRVTIATPRIGQERLLGDEMVFWLRRDGDVYKVYRTFEDFQLP